MDKETKIAHMKNQKHLVEMVVTLSKSLEDLLDNLTIATLGMDRFDEILRARNCIQYNRKAFESINVEMTLKIGQQYELPQSTS